MTIDGVVLIESLNTPKTVYIFREGQEISVNVKDVSNIRTTHRLTDAENIAIRKYIEKPNNYTLTKN